MKKHILLLQVCLVCSSIILAQNVGIGTVTPNTNALLHVDLGSSTTKGLLVTGTYDGSSIVPDLGAGSRMMFYPGKAAFRAGRVFGTEWNNANVGLVSTAFGYSTIASGFYSTAMGYNTTASGNYSTAMGVSTIASGVYSTAMGVTTIASGAYSFAAGSNVSTNGQSGAFFFGDSDPHFKGVRGVGINDQFAARFNGGYYLISSDASFDLGVQVVPGGNSWSAVSDVRLKENFLSVTGESFLKKIATMPLTSWNYKSQDPKVFRHYGPMAQDFFNAFGKDDLGTIGCDTLINQQDFLGVNLIAIQALEKRTEKIEELQQKNNRLEKDNAVLVNKVNDIAAKLDKLQKQFEKIAMQQTKN